jgi:hypothetical protein
VSVIDYLHNQGYPFANHERKNMGTLIKLEKWYALGTDATGVWREQFLSAPNKKIATNHLKLLTKKRYMCIVLAIARRDELTE